MRELMLFLIVMQLGFIAFNLDRIANKMGADPAFKVTVTP